MADNQDDNLVDAWHKRLGDEPGESDAQDATDEEATAEVPGEEPAQSEAQVEAPTQRIDAAPAAETGAADDALTAEFDGTPETTQFATPSGEETTRFDTQPSQPAPAFVPAGQSAGEPPAEDEGEPVKKKRRRWPWITAAAVLILCGAYGGAAYAYQDKIPSNTSISGVQVGGMDEAQARETLAAGLQEALATPRQVAVVGEEKSDAVNPGNISLEVDYDKTFDGLTGFSLDPRRLWAHISGAANVDAVLTADEGALTSEVGRLAEVFKKDPVNAELTIADAATRVTDSQEGLALDADSAGEKILGGWLAGDAPIELPTSTVDPDVTTQTMKDFAASSVDPLLSDAISITVKDSLVELQPAQTAELISVKTAEGAPSLVVDEDKLNALVQDSAGAVLSQPKDATIAIVDGAPKITPSEAGESIDAAQIASALLELPKKSDRTLVADVTVQEPDFTTEDAEGLGIKEVVSEISTPLTNDSVRTTNLVVGTRNVNNTLVKPGEQFNLEEALGPIDAEHGFVSSGVVSNGFNSTAMGGGLSQLSTNTFNIGYRAGMVDVAHQPHSKYFSRYPMGMESTLWSGQISMIWENNTPYGALVETWVADGRVYTRLWSTHYWDVEVWQGQPFNYVQPETKINTAADCEPSPAGGPGFSVTVGRVVKLNGEVHEDSQYTWTYQPVHAVKCG